MDVGLHAMHGKGLLNACEREKPNGLHVDRAWPRIAAGLAIEL